MLAVPQKKCTCVVGSQDGMQTQWDVAFIAQLVATSVHQNGISIVRSACISARLHLEVLNMKVFATFPAQMSMSRTAGSDI